MFKTEWYCCCDGLLFLNDENAFLYANVLALQASVDHKKSLAKNVRPSVDKTRNCDGADTPFSSLS